MKFSKRDILLGAIAGAISAAWSRVLGSPFAIDGTPSAPARHVGSYAHIDRMYRDLYRRLIDPDYFDGAFTDVIAILRQENAAKLGVEEAAARMFAVHSEALRHPPPQRDIPPLPADQIGVDEAMASLRRAICGVSHIKVEQPWREFVHGYGNFEIDTWKLIGFKRSRGIKYLDRAVAPDGRVGTYDSWSAREGNPVHLLTNDEQDAIDELLERAS